MDKLPIKGHFSNEEITNRLGVTHRSMQIPKPKHMIEPHKGFELVELPNGTIAKYAYNKIYRKAVTDLDIELEHIALYEKLITSSKKDKKVEGLKRLKFHYKKAISILSPMIAAGWNRWSDNILELFLDEKIHKVIWGSGNCGKSIIMAVLLYTKWRVRPNERMVVIASKVVKDASARVFGYIKNIHIAAPACSEYSIKMVESQQAKGIFCQKFDEKEGKYVKDDQACIINLPIKVNAKNAEVGANLLGKHPKDRLILAFDEAQELPASMADDKIFVNWYTNKNLDVYAWGNPIPVDYYAKDEHDLLFRLGGGKLSISNLKKKEQESDHTNVWYWNDTKVLHLSMLDSPKDDPDEVHYRIKKHDGTTEHRLHFLAGKDNVKRISEKISPHSTSWFSQVLGFPFVQTSRSDNDTVLNSYILSKTRNYPLRWRTPTNKLDWFMGVDPAISGKYDKAAIVCGRMGRMIDGRMGVDLMNGKYCRQLSATSNKDFTDVIIENMWELSQQLRIPLRNIGVETHGTGEVLRYAISQHIEKGKWALDRSRGQTFVTVSPTQSVTERVLFKAIGKMTPAVDMCADIISEYWVAVRCAVISRQMFNIPDYILTQYYTRILNKATGSKGSKYKVETKEQMKKRGVKSPNDADALNIMFEVCRARGFAFKTLSTHSYREILGQAYDSRLAQTRADARLSIVSRALELGDNFGNFNKIKVRKTKGNVDIESV